MSYFHVSAVFALCGAAGVASAGTIRHDVAPRAYLELAALPQFSGVGQLGFQDMSGQTFNCSGTLISDEWVLTAAHCTAPATSGVFALNGQTYAAAEIITHPEWTGSFFNGFDIALVRLSSTVSAPTIGPLYSGGGEIGHTGVTVGYGLTGDGLNLVQPGSGGTRLAGENVLDFELSQEAPGASSDILMYDFDSPIDPSGNYSGDSEPLPLEFHIQPGDSGGSMWLQRSNGSWAIAGVSSFVLAIDNVPDGSYGELGGFTRVGAHLDWIRSVSGVPAPSGVLLGCTAFASGVIRRRR